MPQDPSMPPKDPATPPGAMRKKINVKKMGNALDKQDAHRAEVAAANKTLLGMKGEYESPEALARMFAKRTEQPEQPKKLKRRVDWSDKTKEYAETLNAAYIKYKEAKHALTPPSEESQFVSHGRAKRKVSNPGEPDRYEFYTPAGETERTPLMKTFYGKTQDGSPGAAYQREITKITQAGASVEEKLAQLGMTAMQAQEQCDAAMEVFNSVAISYQNDIKELIIPLEEKRAELEERLEKASGGRVATGRGTRDLTPPPPPPETPKESIDVVASSILEADDPALPPRDPALPPKKSMSATIQKNQEGQQLAGMVDRTMSTSRLSIELSNINRRIIRAYKTIETIQNIVSGNDRSLFTKRWDPDPEIAKFPALLFLIANRDLAGMYLDDAQDWVVGPGGKGKWVPRSSAKYNVIRGRGERTYEGDELKQVPRVPERPPTDIPPSEAIQRFVEILENIGLDAALSHARMVGAPISESHTLLKSGYFRLCGFGDDESFLNGRHCHLVSSMDDHLIVKILDEDIHDDDRTFKVSFDEVMLIDGMWI